MQRQARRAGLMGIALLLAPLMLALTLFLRLSPGLGQSMPVFVAVATVSPRAAGEALVELLEPPQKEGVSLEPAAEAPAESAVQNEEPTTPPGESILPETKENSDLVVAAESIPAERRGPIEESQFLSIGTGENYFYFGETSVRNATGYDGDEMAAESAGKLGFYIDRNSEEPQILVMHTHTTESFDRFDAGFYDSDYPTRSTDSAKNMVAVGAAFCERLGELGIKAVQATEYHDYPSYNNSYSRSAETVKTYLARYPSIKIVLDLHRDGIEREDGTRVKPVLLTARGKAAQIMIISGADDGSMGMPNFRENLKLAVRIGDAVERSFPGLSRPILFDYRHYNQDLTTGSLLIEVGSHGNTLSEALLSAELLAEAIAGADFVR